MKRISITIAISLLLLLQGCIKEDIPNCENGLSLRFRYTLNNQYTNLFDSAVNQVTIYVFDSNGKYVNRFSERGEVLTNDYRMQLPLPPGTYSLVGYGGDFTTYSIGEITSLNTINQTLRKGITNIADLRVELHNMSGDDGYLSSIHTPDDLYVGLVTGILSTQNSQTTATMELIKITKKVKVKITGTDFSTRASSPLDVYITALNGRYRFNHTIDLHHGTFKYTPIRSLSQPNYMEADLKTMRLMLGQSPMLVIKNSVTAEKIYNENMIEQILSIEKYLLQEDFDREDEFIFEINIQSKDHKIEISVSINGWEIKNVNPDI